MVLCFHSGGKVAYHSARLLSTICAKERIWRASDSWVEEWGVVVSVFARARREGKSMQMRVRRFATFSSEKTPLPIQPWVPGKSSMGLERWTQDVI
jgi:hypothetical protein